MTTRGEKITLIKKLLTGRASLLELIPPKIYIWELVEEKYCNGSLTLSRDAFEDFMNRYKGKHIVLEVCEGCEPLDYNSTLR